MKNPWLEIDYKDYVGHMSSTEVSQYQMINEIFRQSLEEYKPRNIFVPGCTIGNGFEHIDWHRVVGVTAVDINPFYLKVLKEQFGEHKVLKIENEDILNYNSHEKYDLIFAALILEYVDYQKALRKFRELMKENSILVTILQVEDAHHSKVSKTKYKSLEKLGSVMNLLDISKFESTCSKLNYSIVNKRNLTLDSGKSFCISQLRLID